MNLSFVAIDFETATGYMESACSVGIVTVTDGIITDEYYSLIQPRTWHYPGYDRIIAGVSCHLSRSEKTVARNDSGCPQ